MDAVSVSIVQRAGYVNSIRETTGSGSTTNTWITLVSITGRGFISNFRLWSDYASGNFRVTIDGRTPLTIVLGQALPRYISLSDMTVGLPVGGVRLDSSVLVEYNSTDGSATHNASATVVWGDR